MSNLLWLTDAQMAKLKPFFQPGAKKGGGRLIGRTKEGDELEIVHRHRRKGAPCADVSDGRSM